MNQLRTLVFTSEKAECMQKSDLYEVNERTQLSLMLSNILKKKNEIFIKINQNLVEIVDQFFLYIIAKLPTSVNSELNC